MKTYTHNKREHIVESGGPFPTWAVKGFFLFATASRLTEAHPVSYPVGTGDRFPGGKVAGSSRLSLISV
jgi:hypothetical protein